MRMQRCSKTTTFSRKNSIWYSKWYNKAEITIDNQ